MTRFFQLQLRTTDVDAAREFYDRVLGAAPRRIVPLPEQALARGARPHWLGFLDVEDVDGAAAAFAGRGAAPLGPASVSPDGVRAAVMRDPGGAVVALAKPPAGAPARPDAGAAGAGADVAWHLLHTTDVARAKATYAELFGWSFAEPFELAPHGVFHPFAWEAGGPRVGSMSDIATRPGVHAHWLFQLRVAALEPAMDEVRRSGGLVLEPVTLPSGERVAVCDDPQGAAFALRA
jgi:uncharacterized protein